MRTATMTLILLWLASSLSGSAAEPPTAANPAPPATAAPGTAPATTPSTAPAKVPGNAPATASDSASEPDRIEPTEKVHSDAEVSFPVDI